MTLRQRTIRAAIVARTSMRDRAAAAEARAQAVSLEAAAAAARAAAALDQAILDAGSRLAASSSVAELSRIAAELDADKAAVVDAHRVRERAQNAHDGAVADLRQRERQLRTVEHALETMVELRADAVTRDEQKLSDDLSARRRS